MNKIKELLRLSDIQYKLSDYGNDLIMHFIKLYVEDVVLLLGAIFSVYVVNNPLLTVLLIVLALMVLCRHLYLMLRFKRGDVPYIEGVCEETHKTVKTIGVSFIKKSVLGRSDAKIQADGKTYLVPIAHASTFEKGNTLRVYAEENNVYQRDEDTYMIPNPIFISLRKN